MNSVCFQGKPFNITVIQVYAPTSNAEEAEAEWFYEDLQDLLELAPKKDILFIIGDWNAKVGSQEIPHVQGKRNPSKTAGAERGHQRADRLKPQTQKTNQSNHMDHSLV